MSASEGVLLIRLTADAPWDTMSWSHSFARGSWSSSKDSPPGVEYGTYEMESCGKVLWQVRTYPHILATGCPRLYQATCPLREVLPRDRVLVRDAGVREF